MGRAPVGLARRCPVRWRPRAVGLPAAIYGSPYVLYGTLGSARERLLRRRDRLGVSYYTVPSRAMESMAPLVEALAGKSQGDGRWR